MTHERVLSSSSDKKSHRGAAEGLQIKHKQPAETACASPILGQRITARTPRAPSGDGRAQGQHSDAARSAAWTSCWRVRSRRARVVNGVSAGANSRPRRRPGPGACAPAQSQFQIDLLLPDAGRADCALFFAAMARIDEDAQLERRASSAWSAGGRRIRRSATPAVFDDSRDLDRASRDWRKHFAWTRPLRESGDRHRPDRSHIKLRPKSALITVAPADGRRCSPWNSIIKSHGPVRQARAADDQGGDGRSITKSSDPPSG